MIDDLDPGEHAVLLSGLASNCTVDGENPQTVTVVAGESAEVAFDVVCTATTGAITVTTTTGGLSLDPDGYLVTVDGGTGQSLAANGTITLAGIPGGEHEVQVSDVEPNCSVTAGENPQTVTIVPSQTAEVALELTCESLGNRTAFDSNRDGNYEIYIMNPDGSGVTRLTTDPASDGGAVVSPDGPGSHSAASGRGTSRSTS